MVCFSPCGTKVLSGSHDYTLKLWDNYKGVLIHTLRGHTNFVRSCCFSPDGKRIISGSLDNTFKVWDSTEGLEIVSTKARHTNGINSICYNPDGKILVSGGLDSSINVWYGFNSKDRLEQDNAFLASLAKPDPKWHIQNAEDSEKNKQYFVAAFHLRKLIEIEPNNETAKKRLEFIENKLKENK
jgi:WD40 repeat protein